uniref:UDP-glucose/GDP-mannose dehydrogenase dimerisation domain-containing protein n=1 Tax=viral metagenome TaxID=1070528 RepID=A0A6C0ACQ7_9ZZZZ
MSKLMKKVLKFIKVIKLNMILKISRWNNHFTKNNTFINNINKNNMSYKLSKNYFLSQESIKCLSSSEFELIKKANKDFIDKEVLHENFDRLNKKKVAIKAVFDSEYSPLFKDYNINTAFNINIDFTLIKKNTTLNKLKCEDYKIKLYSNVTYCFKINSSMNSRYSLRCFLSGEDIFRKCLIGFTNENILFKVNTNAEYLLRILPYEDIGDCNIVFKNYKSINDIANEVEILNLNKNKENYYLLEKNLNRLYIKSKPAITIDGYDKKYDQLWNLIETKPMTEEEIKINRKMIVSRGSLGYLMSMKEIFKQAIQQNKDYICILDDDVMLLTEDFIEKQSYALTLLGDFEILKFGSSQWNFKNIEINNGSYICNQASNGSFFNVYKNTVFKNILNRIELFDKPFDSLLYGITQKYYCIHPNLAIANLDHISSIFNRSRSEEYSRFEWDKTKYIDKKHKLIETIYDKRKKSRLNTRHFIIGITTVNRPDYFNNCIDSLLNSLDKNIDYTFIISNGGNNFKDDYSKTYLKLLDSFINSENIINLLIVKNNLGYIYHQSNFILYISNKIDFDYGFILNDDILLNKDWDNKYFEASQKTNIKHMCCNLNTKDTQDLVYENYNFKTNGNVLKSNGILLTFTPEIIKKVGYFDEESFKVRGQSHLDFSLRCCRAGFNNKEQFLDIQNSNDYIKLQQEDKYVYKSALELNKFYDRYLFFVDNKELKKRSNIMYQEDRIFMDSLFNKLDKLNENLDRENTKLNIGVIGLGFVGSAIKNSLKKKLGETSNIILYDKFKDGGIGSLEQCLNTNILFLALPTLYSEEKNSYDKTAIIETINYLEKEKYSGLVVIKSTVEPGTTNQLSKDNKLKIIHNPEFLTARTAEDDFNNQNHIVIGLGSKVKEEDNDLIKLINLYKTYYTDNITLLSSDESEAMKLFVNSFYAVKVQFFNELYLLCENKKIDYNKTKEAMLKNGWIHTMHTQVPGPDGKLSYGGACFPKDTKALLKVMENSKTPCKILKGCIEENKEMRKN